MLNENPVLAENSWAWGVDSTSGGTGEGPCLSFPVLRPTVVSHGAGRGPRFTFLLLFQLSAVEAGGSTAFIYANFSVPVVKVRGERDGGGRSSPGSRLMQGVVAEPIPVPQTLTCSSPIILGLQSLTPRLLPPF